MFTGIVEEVGSISAIKKGEKSVSIVIKADKVIKNTKIGDSVCTNGVCLTVTKIDSDEIEVDVMPETLRRTNLGELNEGSKVNLERALMLSSRMGGHIVSGHVDATGNIVSIKKEDNAVWFEISIKDELLKFIVEKGSITVDGISLTVASVNNNFKVSIIPHTAKETTLATKKVGDKVNIECDILAKYIEKLIQPKVNNNIVRDIDEEFLKENGFI